MKQSKITVKKILLSFIGVFLSGVGVAFNSCAGLGNDPIGMLYDGIRCAGNMSQAQLGMASNIVNISLIVILFFIGRRYINIGTLIYVLPYGFCVDMGNTLYGWLAFSDSLVNNIIFSVAGCLILYLGVAFCITADVGVDPFSGTVLTICDAVHKEYRVIKILFDVTLVIVGTLLGGTLGVVTVIAALSAGPLIQFFIGKLKFFLKIGS